MATSDSILDQINKAGLDIHALLRIRSSVEQLLVAKRRDLEKQLAAMSDAFGAVPARRGPGRPAGSKNAAPAAASAAPSAGGKRKRVRRVASNNPGKHNGLSVAAAVRKIIEAKGGKASASEIKKAFDAAGDKRNLNFTLLVRAGSVKRTGSDKKKSGEKGRAGGIYAI
ncbi:MAG: hypothetical protein U0572_04350 [Phycisphaerales bacterium]